MRAIIPAIMAFSLILNSCQVTFDTSGNPSQTTEPSTEAPEISGETAPPEDQSDPPTEAQVQKSDAAVKLESLTLREKICQLFIVTPEDVSGYDVLNYADEQYYDGYDQYPVGGFIFFAKNFLAPEQTYNMIGDMQEHALNNGIGTFMSTDEEGGTVTRVQMCLGTEGTYAMSYYGNIGDYDSAFSAGQIIGTYLSDYGINLDFAPVADVNISPYNELGNRIFSSDPIVVSQMSAAVVDGLHSAGVCSTLKHFPGLGAGNGNTHYGSVYIDRSIYDLRETEFPAFRGGIASGTDFVMVGHQITAASEDELPGDLSKTVVTDWLRNELGFNGIAVTDSQAMGAIANVYASGEAAVMALEAGIDMILMPYDLSAAIDGVEQAVNSGRLTEERIDQSVLKILEKKDKLGLLR